MPRRSTQNRFIRYQILDGCFRDTSRVYSVKDLVAICQEAMYKIDPNLSYGTRMFYNDIEEMKKLPPVGYGIKFIGRNIWRYEDPNFSITQTLPTKMELDGIKKALEVLSRFGIDVEKEIVPKIEESILKKIYNSKILDLSKS